MLVNTFDMRPFVHTKRVLAQQPAITGVTGGGVAFVYRYGAVVFFDVSPTRQQRFLNGLRAFIRQPYEQPETEEVRISMKNRIQKVKLERQ